ncbi:MAG: energy-coupling factor ABC transporter ATP-binding protein [Ignisphaera sp.]
MIEVRNIVVEFSGKTILKNISLDISKGLYLLLGRNGSGKTTLLKTISALVKPTQGFVKVYGKDIHKLSRREIAKLVGYVWQNPYAGFVEASVEDEIRFSSSVLGVDLNMDIVEMLVPRHIIDRDPFTLSGGEAKRVSIASVLAIDQPVWLLDEPFDYLDSEGVEAVVNVVKYGLERGKTIVIASTNTGFIELIKPDSVIIIDSGIIVYRDVLKNLSEDMLKRFGIPSKGMLCG